MYGTYNFEGKDAVVDLDLPYDAVRSVAKQFGTFPFPVNFPPVKFPKPRPAEISPGASGFSDHMLFIAKQLLLGPPAIFFTLVDTLGTP